MRPSLSDPQPARSETAPELTVLAFIAIIGATCLTAALGALAAPGLADPWYDRLLKAPGNPPPFLFATVWPALYTLMAIGACRVWLRAGEWRRADTALGVFFLQLMVNLGWSVIFFHYHLPAVALADIAALWILTVVMIAEFRRFSRVAAQLQYPYLAWLSFAGYLNAWVVFAN